VIRMMLMVLINGGDSEDYDGSWIEVFMEMVV
jgi:hypothetical protein